MRYRVNRRDTGSNELEAYAKSLGFGVAHIGGDWDCDLYYGRIVIPVDWKSPDGDLTPAQTKLVARGFPMRFVSRPEQLDQLRTEISR